MSLRLILADDHQLVREALRALLEKEAGIAIVGEAADSQALLQLAADLQPDVVVMDIGMPGMNGIEATRRLCGAYPEIRVIALSVFSNRQYVMEMLDAGASAYVVKASAGEELLHAIRAVAKGRKYLCPEIADGPEAEGGGAKPNRHPPRLGRREREVLQLLADGLTSIEIGARLHISNQTVEVHRRNIMQKLDIHSVAELTKYAIRHGLTFI